MTDKQKAMVEELMDFVELYKKDFGCRPSQEEVDEFIRRWKR